MNQISNNINLIIKFFSKEDLLIPGSPVKLRMTVRLRRFCLIFNNDNNHGFTLVETIMYIAFISITIGLFVGFGSQMSDLRAKSSVIMSVEASGATTINFLNDYIKRSRQVLLPLANASSTNIVTLKMPDSEPDITFSVVDGILYITEDTGDPVQITSSAVNIKDLSFINTALPGQKDNLTISLDAEYRYHDSKAYEYSKLFQTSVSIR